MENINKNSEEYQYAINRVAKLTGFYRHLVIYMIINTLIIGGTFYDRPFNNENFFNLETFSTAFFWGIGLLVHAVSVFGADLIFGKNWEQKKIASILNKDKNI